MKNLQLKKIKTNSLALLIFLSMLLTISCKQNTREQDRTMQETSIDTIGNERDVEIRAFRGDIRSVGNSGENLSGEIAMRIEGDLMRFTVSAEGLAPEMMHMQYLLVSPTGDETQCPGSVEEVETLGNNNNTTATDRRLRRIPLHMGPTTLNINSDTYPRTNINGELQFSRVISLDSLRNAVRTEYNMQNLDFTNFTFVIRGIPDTQPTSPPVRNTRRASEVPVGCAKLSETEVSD